MADRPPIDQRRFVNHVGLTVRDLATSVAFYRDVVGMEVDRPRVRISGDWFDTLTDNTGAVIDVVMLRAGELVLQLVQYQEGGSPDAATGHSRAGNLHLCINIDDVQAKHAELLATGRFRPTPIVDLPVPGMQSFYVRDPDGVPVEFLQQQERAGHHRAHDGS